MMKSGVYKITCQINGHFYYGSSVNIPSRFQNHLNKLRTKKHRNGRLQRLYDKYGEHSLMFEIVEYCDAISVLNYEQKYIDDNFENPKCINFCKHAKAPMAGLTFSEDHKRKMSESQIRNKYIFHYANGDIRTFNSLKNTGDFFNVKASVVSRWFKRKNLGRMNGILPSNGVVKAEKIGDGDVTLHPYDYKEEKWISSGASSKTQYYRTLC
jgi:group I intron endonuclease